MADSIIGTSRRLSTPVRPSSSRAATTPPPAGTPAGCTEPTSSLEKAHEICALALTDADMAALKLVDWASRLAGPPTSLEKAFVIAGLMLTDSGKAVLEVERLEAAAEWRGGCQALAAYETRRARKKGVKAT
jgi:hypothetical protein